MAINFSQVKKIEIDYPYQQLDYIYFNGTDNYINPNYQFDYSSSNIELEFSLSNVYQPLPGHSYELQQIFSFAETYTVGPNFRLYYDPSYGSLQLFFNNNHGYSYYETLFAPGENVKYKLYINPSTDYACITKDDVIKWECSFEGSLPNEGRPYIMANNDTDEGEIRQFTQGKIYSLKIGTTTYVPCVNLSNNNVGLINSSQTLRTMSGTVNSSSKGPERASTISLPQVEVKLIKDSQNRVIWNRKKLSSISLSGQTTTLPKNTAFSFGGTVTATYSDGSTEIVTSSTTFSGYDMSTDGTYTVTASYTERGITKTATYQLKVYSLVSITLSGQTTAFNTGSAFSFGGTVTAHYYDNTTADVTNSTTFSGYDMSTAGTQTVTATYTENGTTVTATYQITVTTPQSWHTLWSGSKTISYNSSNTLSGTSSNFAYSATDTGTSPKIRVTFSISTTGSSSVAKFYYYNNSTSKTSTKPSSPLTINSASSTNVLGVRAEDTSSSTWYKEVKLTRTTGSGRVSFSLAGSQSNGPGGATVSMTITKIEQYY